MKKWKIGTLVMTLLRVIGGLKRYLFQFSPFHDIKEGLKRFLLFVFPLFVYLTLVTLPLVVFGLWGAEGSGGSAEGSFAVEPHSRTLGFSALDRVSPRCLFGVEIKEVSIRSKR